MATAASELFVGESHSAVYQTFRPNPPSILINKIISFVQEKISGKLEKAIDVGCGTGQSTLVLLPFFENVSGFDVSDTQIKEAKKQTRNLPSLTYCVSSAESIPMEDNAVQLVTVGTALHWFNLSDFFKEVNRILEPKGVLAVYTYERPKLIPNSQEDDVKVQVDHLISEFYLSELSEFWNEKRALTDNLYKDIQLPTELFTEIVRNESIVDRKIGTFADYIGIIKSWSGYQKFSSQDPEGADKALSRLTERVMDVLPEKHHDPKEVQVTVEFSYVLLMGRKIG